ncbi:MAG TPA: hypothetical protein VGS41_15055 [Chthonomonadales bacterium]|nr:hypothetical protein [Chthonomonadales bacterium]
MFDRSINEDALPKVAESDVAHYTRIGTLGQFLSRTSDPPGWTSAWATPVQFLNDRQELILGLNTLLEVGEMPPRSSGLVRGTLDRLLTTGGSPELDAYQMSSVEIQTSSVNGEVMLQTAWVAALSLTHYS